MWKFFGVIILLGAQNFAYSIPSDKADPWEVVMCTFIHLFSLVLIFIPIPDLDPYR